MTDAASLGSDERLRLFCALPVPAEGAERLAAWQREALAGAVEARRLDHFHVTLAFLGSRPAADVRVVVDELREAAAAARPPLLRARRYRETRSVGMLVLDDEDGLATALATDLQARLERLGVYRPERRPWLPHVTVLRFRRQPRLRPDPPELALGPSEAAVYHSVLRPGGAQYEVLESFALKGKEH
jgi:2'-5' RNA ligase